jgi:hypothetical protein
LKVPFPTENTGRICKKISCKSLRDHFGHPLPGKDFTPPSRGLKAHRHSGFPRCGGAPAQFKKKKLFLLNTPSGSPYKKRHFFFYGEGHAQQSAPAPFPGRTGNRVPGRDRLVNTDEKGDPELAAGAAHTQTGAAT